MMSKLQMHLFGGNATTNYIYFLNIFEKHLKFCETVLIFCVLMAKTDFYFGNIFRFVSCTSSQET